MSTEPQSEKGQGAPTQPAKSTGQKTSSERGAHTNHKKNPGKRQSQGGSSR